MRECENACAEFVFLTQKCKTRYLHAGVCPEEVTKIGEG